MLKEIETNDRFAATYVYEKDNMKFKMEMVETIVGDKVYSTIYICNNLLKRALWRVPEYAKDVEIEAIVEHNVEDIDDAINFLMGK